MKKFKDTAAKYISNIKLLWTSRDELRLKNVRINRLHYTLSMVLCVSLSDISSTFVSSDYKPGGLDTSAMMMLAFCVSILSIWILRPRDFTWFFRAGASVAAAGFVGWLLLPAGLARLLSGMVCWFGLGCCAVSATLAFVFILNNAERLLSILAVNLISSCLIFLHEKDITGLALTYIFPAALLAAVVFCMFRYRPGDFPDTSGSPSALKPVGQGALIFCFAAFFAIYVFGNTMLGVVGGNEMFNVGMMLSVAVVLTVQFAFTKSVWHTWNLFLVLASAGVLLMVIGKNGTAYDIGALVFGAGAGTGYVGLLYMAGGVGKRAGTLRFLKLTLFIITVIAVVEYGAADIVEAYFPHAVYNIASAVTVSLFLIFTLFSPALFKALFAHDWMGEFHSVDIGTEEDRFSNFGLSAREKQVCELLLQGYTMRQISVLLKIGYSTVNTYCTSLYRKLGINSRAELFARFGVRN